MREGWRSASVGELAIFVKRGRAPAYSETGLLVLSQKCVRDGRVDVMLGRRTDTAVRPVPDWATLNPGDTLVNSTGTGTLGRVGFLREVLEPMTVDSHVAILRPDPSKVVPAYLGLALGRQQADLVALQSGSTNQTELSPSALSSVVVPLPSLAEQRRIVDLIRVVDAASLAAGAVHLRTREAANRMRDEWFSEALHEAVALEDAVEVTNGRLRNPANASGRYMTRYVRAANVQDGELVMDAPMYMNFTPKEQERYRLRPGDTLVTEGSGSRTSIGASCRWNGEVEGVVCFQNHLLRLRPRPDSGVEPAFVYQWALWSHRTRRFAEIATGTNILSLGVGRVVAMPFPLANAARRPAFVALMEAFDGQEQAAERVARAARQTRNALLGDLLSGAQEIPDSYDRFLDGAA